MPVLSSTHVFSLVYLASFSALLWGVLVALNANAGFDQNRLANALSWAVQVPLAFFTLATSWEFLSRSTLSANWHSLWRIIASATFASLLLCPLFWGTENVVAAWLGIPSPDPWSGTALDLAAVLLEEWSFMCLPFVCVWLLVALPVLHRISPTIVVDPGSDPSRTLPEQTTQSPPSIHTSEPVLERVDASAGPARFAQRPSQPSTAQALPLPAAIEGEWLVAKSELQYLRVWTTKGHALVLGSLAEVERFYGTAGLRVHKSWWVACAAVEQVDKQARATVLSMRNGVRVPVSRRKQQTVLEQLSHQKL